MSIEMTIEDDNGRATYNNPYAWSPGPIHSCPDCGAVEGSQHTNGCPTFRRDYLKAMDAQPLTREWVEQQAKTLAEQREGKLELRLQALENKVVMLTRKADKLLYVVKGFAHDVESMEE
jgi:hypothetical protein